METTSEEFYYYQLPSGEVEGPLEIGKIISELEQGFIPKESLFSRGGDDRWVGISTVKLRLIQDVQPKFEKLISTSNNPKIETQRVPVVAQASPSPSSSSRGIQERSVATNIDIIGWAIMILSFISMLALFYAGLPLQAICSLISGVITGTLFLALSEILWRLKEISRGIWEKN